MATAAGLKVLELMTPDRYEELTTTATALADGLAEAFASAGVAARVPRVGPLVGLFFGEHDPTNYDEAQASVALGRYPAWFHAMLRRGIALAPGPYEVLFPSLAHGPADVRRTIEAAAQAATELV